MPAKIKEANFLRKCGKGKHSVEIRRPSFVLGPLFLPVKTACGRISPVPACRGNVETRSRMPTPPVKQEQKPDHRTKGNTVLNQAGKPSNNPCRPVRPFLLGLDAGYRNILDSRNMTDRDRSISCGSPRTHSRSRSATGPRTHERTPVPRAAWAIAITAAAPIRYAISTKLSLPVPFLIDKVIASMISFITYRGQQRQQPLHHGDAHRQQCPDPARFPNQFKGPVDPQGILYSFLY